MIFPPGLLSHYLRIGEKQEGIPLHTSVHADESSGGKPSSLVVLETWPVKLQGRAAERWGSEAYESCIRLITGRTHQVRPSEPETGPACIVPEPFYRFPIFKADGTTNLSTGSRSTQAALP